MPLSFRILFFIISSALMFACSNNNVDKTNLRNLNSEESLIKANKQMLIVENEKIELFIEHHNWDMESTGSGLRYQIYENGNGPLATRGQLISMDYEVRLINGDLVYSSENDSLKSFVIGHGGVESGLEEVVLFLKKGDRAHIILPSHLAFGLLGDQKRIPSRSTLIYEVSIIDIRN